jgi:hypothetical protein
LTEANITAADVLASIHIIPADIKIKLHLLLLAGKGKNLRRNAREQALSSKRQVASSYHPIEGAAPC